MNTVNCIGNITHDLELRKTPSGKSVIDFKIAFDEYPGSVESVFIQIVAWGGLAESIAQFVGKGSQVGVSGRLCYKEWEDKNGVKQQRHSIIAENVKFPPKK